MSAANDDRVEFLRNPYPFYARWRRDRPLYFDEEGGGWFVSTYADAAALLREPRLRAFRPRLPSDSPDDRMRQLGAVLDRWPIFAHPPDHTHLRKLVTHALSADFVSGRARVIESIAADVVDRSAARHEFDIVRDVAAPIAVLVLADAMGLPRSDGPRVLAWSAGIVPVMDGALRRAHADAAADAVAEAVEYLTPIVRSRMADPKDDLISRIADTQGHAVNASQADVIASAVLLLTAGHETTTALVGNAIVALLDHPEELERLRRHPALGTLAVEEFLRFDSPAQVTSRTPEVDLEWSGHILARDTVVNIVLGSANRDSAQFADGDRLDVGRTHNPHIAFSAGIHVCPGARMARVVGRVTIERILARCPDLARGSGEPVRRPGMVLRGFSSLPVSA